MTMRADDLTSLFTAQPQGPAQPMAYRQGVITAWNPITLQNRVLVAGVAMQDLPVLGVAEAASFKPGVTVGVATIGSSWAIIGRFVIPNTTDAQDAITLLGQRRHTATVATSEGTTSGTFTDLATPGPSIGNMLIPASGKVQVTVSAEINGGGNALGAVGVAVSGAFTEAASAAKALMVLFDVVSSSRVLLYEGLPAGGLCTFTLKYRSSSLNMSQFASRDIVVEAL